MWVRLQLSDGILDLTRSMVVKDAEQALTPLETRLLRYLAVVAPRPVPNDELLEAVWGYAPSARSRAVRVTVGRLRNKIETDPGRPVHLVTVRGSGYRLVADPVRDPSLHAPVPLDAFVGRERMRATVLDRLRHARWVTLEGPPGVGKTRLAQEIARAWPGPVGWFELGDTGQADGAFGRIAQQLGVRLSDPRALGEVLEGRVTLVVLDELERLAVALSPVVDAWLQRSQIRVLATSRVPLGVMGEARIEVPPLDAVSSLELLAERSGLPSAEVAPLAGACDGLPLALELTATAARGLLSPTPRVDDALTDAVRRSWEMLDPPTRTALARCAAFGGAFTLEHAGAVIGPDAPGRLHLLRTHGLLRRAGDRLRLLRSLKTGVEALAPEAVAEAVERHRAWFVGRAFAAGEAFHTADRHAAVDAVIADRAEYEAAIEAALETAPADAAILVGPYVYALQVRIGERGLDWIRRVDAACHGDTEPELRVRATALEANAGIASGEVQAQLADLRERAIALGYTDLGARIAARLGRAFVLLGRWDEADALFFDALKHDPPARFAARLLVGRAKVARVQDAARVKPLLDAALEVVSTTIDPPIHGEVLLSLGREALDKGEVEAAVDWFEQALEVGRAEGEYATVAPLSALANAALVAGRHDAALEGFAELAALATKLGEIRHVAIAQIRRTGVLVERGDDEADVALDETRAVIEGFDSAEIWAAYYAFRFLRSLDVGRTEAARAALESLDALELPAARDLERRYWHVLAGWVGGAPVDGALVDALRDAGQAGFLWGLLAMSALDGSEAAERELRKALPPRGGEVYRALLEWARCRRQGRARPPSVDEAVQSGVLLRLALRREDGARGA